MASVETFKTAVIRIRDILRGPGVSITGMDSMRHICLYLLSRYMTRAKVTSLEVPEEFAWETLIETAQTKNGGVQKALDCFYHAEEDCLVRHFDRLFGTDKFSFDIKNPQKHKEILEILNTVNMAEVDCQMDILGWVYEQHLRTGSSAARDLGQFFTDRFICEYMTELCAPGFKSAGIPESICDPTMGTGGFLTAFVKFYNKHHADKPIDWAVQQKEIHGCDTDPKVAGVARLNLFMETGGNRSTNLLTHDSLYGDLTQTQYDVILANMPFGLKGIKHAECCERVKNLKIRGTKSEPLFLQLMMVSLALGGRCAVVVPDGMLVNSSSCHNDTRKYLLDHFELKRVIKMNGQYFMNTGIKPSILFFENTGKPTTAVEFWEVLRNEKGESTETMLVSVPRAKMDASCSFDMRRYLESDNPVANPAGFPMVKLSDVSDLYSGKANRDADSGDIPFFASSGSVGKRDKHNFEGKYIITARTQSIGSVSYYDGKLWASDNTILMKVKDEAVLTSRFLFYWLMLNKSAIHNIANTGLIPLIRKSDLAEIKMPLPPLPIQQEIVATLDRIYAPGTTELADTLKMTDKAMDLVLANPAGATLEPIVEAQRLIRKSAQMVADVKAQMVADVKAQMVAVVNAVKKTCSTWTTIGELYDNPKCQKKFNSKDMDNKGDVPFFNGKFNSPVGTHSEYSFSSENEYFVMIKDGGGDHSSDSVGMGKFFNVKGKCAITSHNLVISPKIIDPEFHKFMKAYLYCNGKEIRDKAKYSINLGSISVKDVLEFPIPKMDSNKVKSINVRLEALQSQLTALESLQKQSEDNARFILESYLGSSSESNKTISVDESDTNSETNEIKYE